MKQKLSRLHAPYCFTTSSVPINPTFKTSPFQVDDIDDGDENSGSNDDEDGSSENDMRADEEA